MAALINLVLMLGAVAVGAVVTYPVSRYYYQRGSRELRREAEELRRETEDAKHYVKASISYLEAIAEARPPDHRDVAQEIARELVRMGADLSALKGEAYTWLTALEYGALRQRIEAAPAASEAAAVETRRRMRLLAWDHGDEDLCLPRCVLLIRVAKPYRLGRRR